MRVVLNTNVWISGLAFPQSRPGIIIRAWRFGSFEIGISEYILDEMQRVLPRLAHRHHLDAAQIEDLIDTIAILADYRNPTPESLQQAHQILHARDPNDTPILALLLDTSVVTDVLITGDQDLLSLGYTNILNPAAFCQQFGL